MFDYLFVMATMSLTQFLWCQSSTTNAFITIVPSPSASRQLTTSTCMKHRHSLLSSLPSTITAQNTNRVMDHARLFQNNNRKYFMSQQENQDDTPSTTTTTTKSATTEIVDTTTPSNNINNLMDLSPTEFILATENMDPTTRAVVEAAKKKQQLLLLDGDGNLEKKYPIDLPSPVLLATSMILAIISTGSLFQLFGITSSPNPTAEVSSSVASSSFELGFIPTAIIVLIGTPLSIYMLYAAITKATAETEADDQAFLSGK